MNAIPSLPFLPCPLGVVLRRLRSFPLTTCTHRLSLHSHGPACTSRAPDPIDDHLHDLFFDNHGHPARAHVLSRVLSSALTARSRVDLLGLGRVLLEQGLGPRPDALGLAVGEREQGREERVRERLGRLARELEGGVAGSFVGQCARVKGGAGSREGWGKDARGWAGGRSRRRSWPGPRCQRQRRRSARGTSC